jgi:hypothetical protein
MFQAFNKLVTSADCGVHAAISKRLTFQVAECTVY